MGHGVERCFEHCTEPMHDSDRSHEPSRAGNVSSQHLMSSQGRRVIGPERKRVRDWAPNGGFEVGAARFHAEVGSLAPGAQGQEATPLNAGPTFPPPQLGSPRARGRAPRPTTKLENESV